MLDSGCWILDTICRINLQLDYLPFTVRLKLDAGSLINLLLDYLPFTFRLRLDSGYFLRTLFTVYRVPFSLNPEP
ncbi:hypothetical protein MASR2M47_13270 [Draconibacterium sp.]